MITEEQIAKLRKIGKVPEYRKSNFPPDLNTIYDNRLVNLLGEANRAIGNLNSYARIVPNPDLLTAPLLLREALDSSKIEGTQATARDIVEQEAGVELSQKTKGEALEVINHREAMKLGLTLIKDKNMPLVNRVIKKMHERLMVDARGDTHRRGEFRKGSNVIATRKDIDSVIFLPPPADELPDLMSRLEEFLNTTKSDDINDLFRCALMHYEFEAIHSFADGNGRLGRVLIPLFLIKENVLEYPLLYVSGYLLKNRDEYYQSLLNITKESDWKSWIIFFLISIVEQAKKSRELLEKIYNLYKTYENQAEESINSPYIHRIVEQTFKYPVITSNILLESMKDLKKHDTAITNLRRLADLGLLQESKKHKRNIPFYNERLIRLLEEA